MLLQSETADKRNDADDVVLDDDDVVLDDDDKVVITDDVVSGINGVIILNLSLYAYIITSMILPTAQIYFRRHS